MALSYCCSPLIIWETKRETYINRVQRVRGGKCVIFCQSFLSFWRTYLKEISLDEIESQTTDVKAFLFVVVCSNFTNLLSSASTHFQQKTSISSWSLTKAHLPIQGVPKKTRFQNAAGATVHRLNPISRHPLCLEIDFLAVSYQD